MSFDFMENKGKLIRSFSKKRIVNHNLWLLAKSVCEWRGFAKNKGTSSSHKMPRFDSKIIYSNNIVELNKLKNAWKNDG